MTLSDASLDPNWDHLARRLVLARTELKLNRAEAARQANIAYATLKEFERGPWPSRPEPTPTMRAYAAFLGWTPDSVDTVLAGGEPTTATDYGTYVAVAAGVTAEEQVAIIGEIMASNLSAERKAWLARVLLGPNG